jgi:hypothetical protein
MANSPADLALAEWQECRTSIGRFDSIIADNRKFGFTLVTGLLTANALVSGTGHARASILAALITEVLVLALYLIDRYYWVLLLESVIRATDLEVKLVELKLTQYLSKLAQATEADIAALAAYVIFMAVAAALPLLLEDPVTGPIWLPIIVGIVLGVVMAFTYFWTNARLTKKTPRSAPAPH